MDNQNNNPKQALLERVGSSTNILVTVSANPTVDQLAACLGLTLWLNKTGKHATAVFSGEVPSTMEFLQPEATLEKNTDSLRDFIISLDKSKADKLRYKVEDKVVKVFVTPYRTSLTADDLEFSQGDFNVDMVIALGVSSQADIDAAITAHGRILHDATVASITTSNNSELGSINWHDSQASSLSELVADLGNGLDRTQLDGQIATALLTGVVAETERFSNEKTTPQTMSVSAELMSAGANQQLVASKLEEPVAVPEPVEAPVEDHEEPAEETTEEPPKSDDGTIEISHEGGEEPAEDQDQAEPEVAPEKPQENPEEQPVTQDEPQTETDNDTAESEQHDSQGDNRTSKMITEPPTLGGTLTANSRPDDIMTEPASDPMTLATTETPAPLLDRSNSVSQPVEPTMQPAPFNWTPPAPAPTEQPQPVNVEPPKETLAEIEQSVHSPHLEQFEPDVNAARDEVMKAINAVPETNPEPIQALNAQPIELNQAPAPVEPTMQPTAEASTTFDPTAFGVPSESAPMPQPAAPEAPAPVEPELTGPVEQPYTMPLPSAMTPPPANPVPPTSNVNDPTAPPPVPPPLMPPGFPPAQ